ncbi:MAG: carbon dioxide concentrating mechanism protein CcmL [Phycisphaeraceae bacterium]|nr:carbon dioxide concentrating mechanism protein CcmL [Phycisphaeraceae bacterium]
MRIGRVTGQVTLGRKLAELPAASLLVVEALDVTALLGHDQGAHRAKADSQSLVVLDQLGAAVGQLIAVSEGREATMPFYPQRVPIDGYCAAILDQIEVEVPS